MPKEIANNRWWFFKWFQNAPSKEILPLTQPFRARLPAVA